MKVFVNVIISRYPQVQSCEYTNGLQLKLLPHKGAFGGPETVQKSSSKVKIFDNKLARYSMFSQCYEPIHVTSTNELLGCDYDIMHLQNAPRRKLLYSDYQYNCIIGFSYADWSAFPSDRKSITGQGTVYFLVQILYHGRVRCNLLSLNQVQSQLITLWLILHVSLYVHKMF